MDGQLVTVIVSDPFEFPDENEGRIAFLARIIGSANGKLLLRFSRPVIYKGRTWNYAIPSTRYQGQGYFGEPEQNEAANILFVSDSQASDGEYLSSFNDQTKPATPWVVGSLTMGIAEPISEGEDSYREPRWVPPQRR
jgi:hypothetical protein